MLLDSFYTAFTEETVHADGAALEVRDIIKVIYNESTKKFVFTCGPSADYIKLTLSPKTSALFGFEGLKEEVIELTGNQRYKPAHSAWTMVEQDKVWYIGDTVRGKASMQLTRDYREGMPQIAWCEQCPPSLTAPYPAQLSLGVDNIFVETDIINPVVWVGNDNRQVLGVVPIDFTTEGYNTYTPLDAPYIRVNRRHIDRIRLSLKDYRGKRIKFMSNDTSTVVAQLHFKRVA